MRTARLRKNVLHPICHLLDVDPETELENFPASRIFSAINERAAEAWDELEAPETTITEERAFRQIYFDTVAYPAGSEIYSPEDGQYYRALVDTIAGDLPTDGTKFELIDPLDKYIELDQYAKQLIGEVLGVWTENPRTSSSAQPVEFEPGPNGVDIASWAGPTVWIEFVTRPSEFSGTTYDAGATYARDDVVYDPATGECYLSLIDGNTGVALTDTTKWLWQPMPYDIAGYVKFAAASDCSDDAQDKAQWIEEAQLALARAFDRLGAQGQKSTYRFTRPVRRRGRDLIGDLP